MRLDGVRTLKRSGMEGKVSVFAPPPEGVNETLMDYDVAFCTVHVM